MLEPARPLLVAVPFFPRLPSFIRVGILRDFAGKVPPFPTENFAFLVEMCSAAKIESKPGEEVFQPVATLAQVKVPWSLWRSIRNCCTCVRPIIHHMGTATPVDTSARSLRPRKRKTLVLDLDETLVHSSTVPAPFPDAVLPLAISGSQVAVYVYLRPGLQHLLETAHEHYQIVIYTASIASYADRVIDFMDPQGLVDARLFREDCKRINGAVTKDLKILGRNMKEVVIVDVPLTQNSPDSYRYYKKNAIPIVSFIDDKEDKELFKVAKLLQDLASFSDVRVALRTLLKQSGMKAQEHTTLARDSW